MPEFGGRLTRNLPENTVEMGQRLETDVVSNFAHSPIRIEQLGLCSFDTYSTQILGKCQACRLLEHFTEIESADMHRPGHILQVDGIRLMPDDVSSGSANHRRLGLSLLQHNLVRDYRQMLRKNFQELDHRRVLMRGQNPGVKICVFEFREIDSNTPFYQLFGYLPKLLGIWLTQSYLTRLQEPNDPVSEMHRDRGVAESGETGDCRRPRSIRLGNPLLDLKARGAGAIAFSHQLAERVRMRLPRHSQVPDLDRPESKRKFRRIAKGLFVVFKNFRTRNSLNDVGRPIHKCTVCLATEEVP